MSLSNDYTGWLKRGKQRAAIARVLKKPMTASEICAAAREFAPRLQLRDVWFLMCQMTDRGLAVPLNERSNIGRLYALTDQGRKTAAGAFNVLMPEMPTGVAWRLYSWVARARIRRRVLLGLAQIETQSAAGQTGSGIRNFIRTDYPVGLNPVLRAVRELADKRLISCVGVTKLRACKLYRLTPRGQAIVRQLRA